MPDEPARGGSLFSPSRSVFRSLVEKKRKPFAGVPLPLPSWNRVSLSRGRGKGLAGGWQVVIAGKSGQKKTALGVNLAAHAIRRGVKVAYVSLELDYDTLLDRLCAVLANRSLRSIGWNHPNASAEVYESLRPVLERNFFANAPNRDIEVEDLVADMDRFAEGEGVGLFIVDYVQLLAQGSVREIFDKVAKLSREVWKANRRNGTVSILLSQFNREAINSGRPSIEGLFGGAMLEQDADPNEAKTKARKRAEDLLKRIKDGEDFAEIAKANSACPSAPNGGDLNFFPRGEMTAEFDKVVFELEIGQVSDVVETKYGFHIIKATDHKDPADITFEQARKEIIEQLTQEKQSEFVEEYLKKLKAEAKIVYPTAI